MPSQLEIPKPKILLKMVFTHNQNIECLADRYTEEELDKILSKAGTATEPIKFWGCDENAKPVKIVLMRPKDLIGYLFLDFDSFASLMRRAQLAQAGHR